MRKDIMTESREVRKKGKKRGEIKYFPQQVHKLITLVLLKQMKEQP